MHVALDIINTCAQLEGASVASLFYASGPFVQSSAALGEIRVGII